MQYKSTGKGQSVAASAEALPDDHLILMSQEGDRDSFEELYHRYQQKLFGLAFSLADRNADSAEEIVQEAFYQAYRSIRTFKFKSAPYTWLYRITHNVALGYLKRERREKRKWADQPLHEVDETRLDSQQSARSPEREVLRRRQYEAISYAIRSLPLSQRQVMILGPIQGHSYAEIAKRLGATEDKVKGRLHRARENVKGRIAGAQDMSRAVMDSEDYLSTRSCTPSNFEVAEESPENPMLALPMQVKVELVIELPSRIDFVDEDSCLDQQSDLELPKERGEKMVPAGDDLNKQLREQVIEKYGGTRVSCIDLGNFVGNLRGGSPRSGVVMLRSSGVIKNDGTVKKGPNVVYEVVDSSYLTPEAEADPPKAVSSPPIVPEPLLEKQAASSSLAVLIGGLSLPDGVELLALETAIGQLKRLQKLGQIIADAERERNQILDRFRAETSEPVQRALQLYALVDQVYSKQS